MHMCVCACIHTPLQVIGFGLFWAATPLVQPGPKLHPGSSPPGQKITRSHLRRNWVSLEQCGENVSFSPQCPPLSSWDVLGLSDHPLPLFSSTHWRGVAHLIGVGADLHWHLNYEG